MQTNKKRRGGKGFFNPHTTRSGMNTPHCAEGVNVQMLKYRCY
jgi:hypothetical protein